MDDQEKSSLREVAFREWAENTRNGYAELGEFIVEFSQLEFTIRVSIGRAINLQDHLINVVLSLYDFSSLCRVWKQVMLDEHPNYADRVESIFKKCMYLNDNRVYVAHGLWSPSNVGIEAVHVSRNSSKSHLHFSDPEELKTLAIECQNLLQEVLIFPE